jgi:hypothetical protein
VRPPQIAMYAGVAGYGVNINVLAMVSEGRTGTSAGTSTHYSQSFEV